MQKIFRDLVNELKEDKFTLVLRVNGEIFCRQLVGRKRLIRIPLHNSDDLSFLAGIIIGDGHLGRKKRRIQLEMNDYRTLIKVARIFHEVFNVRTSLRIVKKQELNYQQTWRIVFESKEISLFLNKIFEIPLGKKSHIVRVPAIIFESDANLKRSFIKGLFLADGSLKKKTIRFSSKSNMLIDDLARLFKTIGFNTVKRCYRNETFNSTYFELFLMTEEAERFKLEVPDILIKTKPESPSLAMAQDRIVRNLRI